MFQTQMSYMKKNYRMRICSPLPIVLLAATTLSFVGCGDASIAPVSGKVTLDGAPVAGIRLVFSPILKEGQNVPGPWSSGLTNEAGDYSLETRHKDNGAVVGTHTVVFVYDDRDNLGKYQENLREAKQDGDQASMDAAQKNIDNYKAVKKTRPRAPYDNYSEKFEVPLGGTAEANFQLPE